MIHNSCIQDIIKIFVISATGKTSPQTTMIPTSPKPFSCPSASGYFPVSPDACEANYYLCVDNTPYPQVRCIQLHVMDRLNMDIFQRSIIDLPWKPRF